MSSYNDAGCNKSSSTLKMPWTDPNCQHEPGCPTPAVTPLVAKIHNCDDIHPRCTLIKFNGLFHVALENDATGNPNDAAYSHMWSAGYASLNGELLALLLQCGGLVDRHLVEGDTTVNPDGSTEVCFDLYDANAEEVLEEKAVCITIPAPPETVEDTAGTYAPDPANPGQGTVSFPDGSSVCVYDCSAVESLLCVGSGLYMDNNTSAIINNSNQGFNQPALTEAEANNSPVSVSGGVFTFLRNACVSVSIGKEVAIDVVNNSSNIAKLYSLVRLAPSGVVSSDLSRHTRVRELVDNDQDNLSLNSSESTSATICGNTGDTFIVDQATYITSLNGGSVTESGAVRVSVQVVEQVNSCVNN
jgi:hypothetical protein